MHGDAHLDHVLRLFDCGVGDDRVVEDGVDLPLVGECIAKAPLHVEKGMWNARDGSIQNVLVSCDVAHLAYVCASYTIEVIQEDGSTKSERKRIESYLCDKPIGSITAQMIE